MKKIFIIFSLMFCQLVFADIVKSNIGAKNIAYAEDSDGGISAKDYVQDGLVALYDGIENVGWGRRNPNAVIWRDLIGGNDLSYSATLTPSIGYWDVNGFHTIASGRYYWQCIPSETIKTILQDGLPITIEIVATLTEVPNAGTSSFLHISNGAAADGCIIGYNSQMVQIGCQDAWASNTGRRNMIIGSNWNFLTKTLHIGAVLNGYEEYGYMFCKSFDEDIDAYLSGIPQFKLTINLSKMTVGGYAWASINNRNMLGVYHCNRVYDRALSGEELSYNHKVDLERFALP